MKKLQYLFTVIILSLLTISYSQFYGLSKYFYTHHIILTERTTGIHTFWTVTPVTILNVRKAVVACAEIQKQTTQNIGFNITVSPSALNTQHFWTTLNIITGVNIKYGFFLVVISNQPAQKFIDIVQIIWNPLINTNVAGGTVRTQTIDTNISSLTYYPSTSGKKFFKFISYFEMDISLNDIDGSGNPLTHKISLDLQIVNGSYIQNSFFVNPDTVVTQFCSFIIIIDQSYLGLNYQRQMDIKYEQGYFKVGPLEMLTFQMKNSFSSFKHNMINKCLMGIVNMQIYNHEPLMYQLTLGDQGTFSILSEKAQIATKGYVQMNAFCYGTNYIQLLCENTIKYCIKCTDIHICTQCQYPYKLSVSNLCTDCQTGFTIYGGYCIKQQGCKNMAYKINDPTLPNDVCMSCITELNWAMDRNSRNCICAPGFKKSYNAINQPICVTACGDGIVSIVQQCDDGNFRLNDGCNDECNVESLFTCQNSPSQCILYYDFKQVYYNYAYKIERQNKGALSFSILPICYKLKWVDFSKIVFINVSNTHMSNINFTFNQQNGQLLVLFDYSKQLEFQKISTKIYFDPQVVVSLKTQFLLNYKIKGINAPLILQSESIKSNYYLINIFGIIVSVLGLIQFYIGSYYGKMLGLETIQAIQIIYFGLMTINDQNSSILNSLDTLKYSNGFSNSGILFGDSDYQLGSVNAAEFYSTVNHMFVSLNFQKYFLDNVSILLIPIPIVFIIYMRYFTIKFRLFKEFNKTKQLKIKDQYVIIKRKTKWIYNNFLYPFVMLLFLVVFIQTGLYLQSTLKQSSFTNPAFNLNQNRSIVSYSFHEITLYIIFIVICLQIYSCFQQHKRNLNSQNKKPQSNDDLQHDQNDPKNNKFHYLYPIANIIFQMMFVIIILMGTLVFEDTYQLKIKSQLILVIMTIYFFIIIKWKPYNDKIKSHNNILIFNCALLLLFLVISVVLNNIQNAKQGFYLTMAFIFLGIGIIIIIGGYYRIYLEYLYKIQQQTKGDINGSNKKLSEQTLLKLKLLQRNKHKMDQFVNNQFLFDNQLKQIKKKYGLFNSEGTIMSQIQRAQLIQMVKRQNKVKYLTQQQQKQLNQNQKLKQKKQQNKIKNNQIIKQQNQKNKHLNHQYQNYKNYKKAQPDQLKKLKYKLNKQWIQLNFNPNSINQKNYKIKP